MTTPNIISRAMWGARHREGFGTRSLPVRFYFAHHSVTNPPPPNATAAQDYATMRTLEDIGQSRFGGGVSYSYAIMPSGRILQGLRDHRIGAHTRGYNTTGIAIVFVGNYETNQPTEAQIASAVALSRYLRAQGSTNVSTRLQGHRDVGATACPGRHIYSRLGGIEAASRSETEATPVSDLNYRWTYGWAETLADRTRCTTYLRGLGFRVYEYGPTFKYHATTNDDRIKSADAYIDKDPKLHRYNGDITTQASHTGGAPRNPSWSDNFFVVATLDDWKARYDALVLKIRALAASV